MRIYASGRPLYQITHQIHDLMVNVITSSFLRSHDAKAWAFKCGVITSSRAVPKTASPR